MCSPAPHRACSVHAKYWVQIVQIGLPGNNAGLPDMHARPCSTFLATPARDDTYLGRFLGFEGLPYLYALSKSTFLATTAGVGTYLLADLKKKTP